MFGFPPLCLCKSARNALNDTNKKNNVTIMNDADTSRVTQEILREAPLRYC